MFENMPYTNFHELNLDWLITVYKDFMNKYNHIEDLIASGQQQITTLTDEGLASLRATAAELTELMNQWYNTHSEDIAAELARAITSFNNQATAKAEQAMQTIPQDYSEIDLMVKSIQTAASRLLDTKEMLFQSGYINASGEEASNVNYIRSYFVPVKPIREGIILYNNLWGNANIVNVISFYDAEKKYISGLIGTGLYQSGDIQPPENARFARFSTLKQYVDESLTQIHITPSIFYENWANQHMILPIIDFNSICFCFDGYLQGGDDFYGNSAFIRTDYIPVKAGDSFNYYNLKGNANAISVWALFDMNKTPLTHLQSTGADQTGTVTAEKDGFIIFSCLKESVTNEVAKIKYNRALSGTYNLNVQTRRYITEDMEICTMGDSITLQTWTDQKWQNELMSNLRITGLQNLAFDGKPVSTSSGLCSEDIISQISANATIVIIMAGVNDWAWNVPIGDRTYENTDINTFFGACNMMFRRVTARKPTARIVAFGTTFARLPNRENFDDPVGFKNNLGLRSLDYSKAMMESAELNGIEHYNIGGNLCINEGNYTNYYRDSDVYLHPNLIMSVMISSFMTKCLGA